jgi:hypothetical protein
MHLRYILVLNLLCLISSFPYPAILCLLRSFLSFSICLSYFPFFRLLYLSLLPSSSVLLYLPYMVAASRPATPLHLPTSRAIQRVSEATQCCL